MVRLKLPSFLLSRVVDSDPVIWAEPVLDPLHEGRIQIACKKSWEIRLNLPKLQDFFFIEITF